MDITLQPGKLSGKVTVPPSKSIAHRMLICAAFSDTPTQIVCQQTNDDIEATVEALQQICHFIARTEYGYEICPCRYEGDPGPYSLWIRCHESGSTLRFLLPITGALGVDAVFELEGRLPYRPLSPLWEEMQRMGCKLSRPTNTIIQCTGKLHPGTYRMDGNVSSQFISGLMMALPLIDGETSLEITGTVESKPYIDMTQFVLDQFSGAHPERMVVEGDWSSAAFWLAANALGSNIDVAGINEGSVQGDKAVAYWLPKLCENVTISAKDIPDLIPVLSIVAATNKGAVFTDIGRLRLKESDRVAAIMAMLTSLGGKADTTEDTLTVYGTGLKGGTVCSFSDHRIAMSAAIAATVCKEPVTILGAECVKKSYPGFWEEYKKLTTDKDYYRTII